MGILRKTLVYFAVVVLILCVYVYSLHTNPRNNQEATALASATPDSTLYTRLLTHHRDTTSCSDDVCSNLLAPGERRVYRTCSKRIRNKLQVEPAKCTFLNVKDRQPIALASFPGSGNTWVRGLLQKVTGYCTGSIYCDGDLRRRGFPGENIMSGSVLVTKTHRTKGEVKLSYCHTNCTLKFDKAILIVRDPFYALIAEWNRRKVKFDKVGSSVHGSSHVSSVGEEYFGNNPHWKGFVSGNIKGWKNSITYWITNWSAVHPLHVVKYEDILENSGHEVTKIVQFIGMKIDEEDVRKKLGDGYNNFHRSSESSFTHFTMDQTTLINKYLSQVQERLESQELNTVFNLSFDKYKKTVPI